LRRGIRNVAKFSRHRQDALPGFGIQRNARLIV